MADSLNKKAMDINKSVEFLYKTMLERDPQKRRVKPVQPHLLQLDFAGLENSSDDSDFKVTSDEDDDDDADDEDLSDASGGNSSASEESSGKRSNASGNPDDENAADPKVITDVAIASGKAPSEETVASSVSSRKFKIQICSVCLGDSSNQSDEIIECDSCFASVHEGCYGVSESQSAASSDSSSSMEPWFCDACKAGVTPHCELCPNLGGIFKETDAGRWVHLVCALYTPGVAFGDVDKLNNVTLFEMPYSKWGAKECSFCEDIRFSRTGVCICCDAGMCRVYFHVTCAQREGLLTEASPDEEIADPFYAYCKQHADRTVVRLKHCNYLALQSNMKSADKDRGFSETDKARIQGKLSQHQRKYQLAKSQRPAGWIPKDKLPRMLLTSAYALRHLLKKAELLGICSQEDHSKDIRKKGYVAPALTTDYVSYYHDRNELIDSTHKNVRDLINQKEKLHSQEKILHAKYEKLTREVAAWNASNNELQQTGEKIWAQLTTIFGRRIRIPDSVSFKNIIQTPVKKDVPKSPTSLIHRCGICKKINDQHLLVKCDRCRQHHHMGCLDPPLTRMPKKTKLQGWQCSQCAVQDSSDADAQDIDTNKPRQLREKKLIKEPLKYTMQFNDIPRRKENRMKRKKSFGRGVVSSKRRMIPANELKADEEEKNEEDDDDAEADIESEESDENKETASEKPVVISRSNLQKSDRATSKLALKTGKELKPRIRKPRVTNPLKVARKNKTFKPLILTRRAKSAASGRVVRNSRKTVVNLSPNAKPKPPSPKKSTPSPSKRGKVNAESHPSTRKKLTPESNSSSPTKSSGGKSAASEPQTRSMDHRRTPIKGSPVKRSPSKLSAQRCFYYSSKEDVRRLSSEPKESVIEISDDELRG